MFKMIVLALLVANIISFLVFMVVAGGYPDLVCYRKTTNNRMVYIVAGNLGQADEASAKIVDDIVGGITFVNFSNYGYSPSRFTQRILEDIVKLPPDTEVVLVAISLGNGPALRVSNYLDAPLYAINPCLGVDFLNKPMKTACISLAVVGTPLQIGLGWLSYIPIFNLAAQPPTRDYSIATLIDQFRAIWVFESARPNNSELARVVISDQDELLENSVISKFFADSQIIEIDARHGSISNYPEAYRTALHELGLFD